MTTILKLFLIGLTTGSLFFTSSTQAEDGKHVVIVVGTHHYTPNKTMPLFAKELERLGLKTTVINPDWNPEKGDKGLPRLDALAKADLVLFFTRFLKLPDDQLKHITDYLESGSPVMGLRTSTHAFNYPESNPNHAWNDAFGRDALGTPYLIHLVGSTRVKAVEAAKSHPILTGVDLSVNWVSPGTLYLTNLAPEGVTPLLLGTGKSKRTGKVTNSFGTHQLESEMTDTIAWTWTNKWGGRTFTSSLGHVGDFANTASMRVMVNGTFWALGQKVPATDQKIETFSTKTSSKKKKAQK